MQSKVQELNRQAQEVDQELAPKKHEDSQEQIKECEKFTRDVLKNVLQRFISEKLVQAINSIIDDYVTNLKMPKDINK